MPLTYTIPGTTRTEDIIDHAVQAIPAYTRSPERPREELHAIAAALRGADDAICSWERMAYIETAEGPWLDQHARDRSQTRQGGESDEALRARLLQTDDAVNVASILAAANAVLAAAGVAGTAVMVELPRDGAYMGVSLGSIRSFFNRGYRMFRTGRPMIIIILPAGTPAAVVKSVSDVVRTKKAGGVVHSVEPN